MYNPVTPGPSEQLAFSSRLNKPLPSGATVSFIYWSLWDSDGTAFNSDAVPATAFDVQKFGRRWLEISGGGSDHYEIVLIVETAELAAPPIDVSPASGSLLPQQNFDAAVLLPADANPSSLQVSVGGTVLPLESFGNVSVAPAKFHREAGDTLSGRAFCAGFVHR